MNWCWTDKFHSEQISNSFSSFKPSAHFKVLISNIHCSKIERHGLLWCTRLINQIKYLIWHIGFLSSRPKTLIFPKHHYTFRYGFISRMQRDPAKYFFTDLVRRGGPGGGIPKIRQSFFFQNFGLYFLTLSDRKKQVLYGPKTTFLAFWSNFVP